jgi:Txe/YoeB family toxin of Txe-Axe toxin-antitoxin module
MDLSEDDLRDIVREMLADGIQEYDALYSKEKDWKQESKELRALLVDLLKNIENDDYREGVGKIDTVVNKLNTWKRKIEKFLD